ncbi:MAG TPA: hypothetical protein ENI90_01730, partial [Methylothermaceae bacterium]|nr:hypothetical protein [Methylothermaceae bacterium]
MTLRSLHQYLTRRLLAVIVPLLVAVGGIVGGYAGRGEVAESDAKAALAASRAKERILMTLQTVAEVPRVLATLVAEHPPEERRLRRMLIRALQVNPDIYGMALAAEPGGLYPDRNEYCLYAFRQGGSIRFRRLDSPTYRYLRQPWYQRPRKLRRAVWSEPYFDAGGGEALMSTYSVPLVSRTGRFLGVATADVTLEALKGIVETVAV